MPAFITQRRGTVVRIASALSGGPSPFAIRMQAMDIGAAANPTTRAIITQAGITENGNFQFLHTFNETIYAYVFGDRIGEFKVSGICFTNMCGAQESGIKQIVDAYNTHKISAQGTRILINFGDVAYAGFLTGMTTEVTDAERNLGQWAFRFHTIPGGERKPVVPKPSFPSAQTDNHDAQGSGGGSFPRAISR